MIKKLRIIVKGKVQGVGFRYFAFKEAERFQIAGTVENRRDGTVLIFASGTFENLNHFISKLKLGSQFARVVSIQTDEVEFDLMHDSFKIIRSGL